MMAVPKVMPSPRQQIHGTFCAAQFECRFSKDVKPGDVSVWCRSLDELLDLNDEMLLHTTARTLESRWENMPIRPRNTHGPGVLWAKRETDPFEEFDGDGMVDMMSPNAGATHEDCSACVAGRKHYHRKSDGSPVGSYALPVEEET